MSQSTAVRPLVGRTTAAAPRPRLTVVSAPRRQRSGAAFVVTCLALVVGALVVMLLVNTARAENSFAAGRLRSESANLSAREATLHDELDDRGDPDWLADRAGQLGMLPAGAPGYLDAATGTVSGAATLPDPREALTVLTKKFADTVPPLVRDDKRPTTQGVLSPLTPGQVPTALKHSTGQDASEAATKAPAPPAAAARRAPQAAAAVKPQAEGTTTQKR